MAVAILAGATGLVGAQLLDLLLADDHYTRVVALSRRPIASKHSKLENLVTDFDSMDHHASRLTCDDVFCCLGTTIRQAGSQAAFRKVDYEYPLALAQITHAQGARQYLIVTALGSDKNSRIFYNRVKGEVEQATTEIGFDACHIFQPSMLLGDRKEKRDGESAGKWVMKALDFAIPKKYKAIDSAKVARAMMAIARRNQAGVHRHASAALQDF